MTDSPANIDPTTELKLEPAHPEDPVQFSDPESESSAPTADERRKPRKRWPLVFAGSVILVLVSATAGAVISDRAQPSDTEIQATSTMLLPNETNSSMSARARWRRANRPQQGLSSEISRPSSNKQRLHSN